MTSGRPLITPYESIRFAYLAGREFSGPPRPEVAPPPHCIVTEAERIAGADDMLEFACKLKDRS